MLYVTTCNLVRLLRQCPICDDCLEVKKEGRLSDLTEDY